MKHTVFSAPLRLCVKKRTHPAAEFRLKLPTANCLHARATSAELCETRCQQGISESDSMTLRDRTSATVAQRPYSMSAPRDGRSASAIRLSTVFSSRKRSGVIFTPYSSSSMMYSAKPIIDPQPGTVRNSSSGVTSGTSSMSATLPRKSSLSSIVQSDHFLVTL